MPMTALSWSEARLGLVIVIIIVAVACLHGPTTASINKPESENQNWCMQKNKYGKGYVIFFGSGKPIILSCLVASQLKRWF